MIRFIGHVKDSGVDLTVWSRDRTAEDWREEWEEIPHTFLRNILLYENTETNQIIVVDNRQGTGQPVKTYPDLDTAKVAVTLQGE